KTYMFFARKSSTISYALLYSFSTLASLRSALAAIHPWIWSGKVSTCLVTLRPASKPFTASASSSFEARKQKGTWTLGPSAGSTIAGWQETAAEKGEEVEVASVTTLPPQQY